MLTSLEFWSYSVRRAFQRSVPPTDLDTIHSFVLLSKFHGTHMVCGMHLHGEALMHGGLVYQADLFCSCRLVRSLARSWRPHASSSTTFISPSMYSRRIHRRTIMRLRSLSHLRRLRPARAFRPSERGSMVLNVNPPHSLCLCAPSLSLALTLSLQPAPNVRLVPPASSAHRS